MKQKKILLPKLTPYQEKVFAYIKDDNVKTIVLRKGRQCGGTVVLKVAVLYYITQSKGEKIGYFGPTSKLVRTVYSELINMLEPIGLVESTNAADMIINTITGSTIRFYSAESKDSIRGQQSSVTIIDEAAFIDDNTYNLIIRPTSLAIGKKTIMVSTPFLANGFFHQAEMLSLDVNFSNTYKSVTTNIYENPFVEKDEIAALKATVPEMVWRCEYMGEFLEDDGAVFKNYKNCIVTNPVMNGQYYAAIDWAKSNDYTVLTIMNSIGQVVHTYRTTGLDYVVQVDIIAQQLNKWKPIETISEENNIGAVVNELLSKAYTGKLRKVTLTNELKKEIIERLVVAFETEAIGIPDDKQLLNELSWFSMEYNPKTQRVTYGAKSNLHDDMVISLAYANYYRRNERKYIIG